MQWATIHGYAVFTHDLDFGTMLALTGARGPSVLQVLGLNVLPEAIGSLVLSLLSTYASEIEQGALLVVGGRSTATAGANPAAGPSQLNQVCPSSCIRLQNALLRAWPERTQAVRPSGPPGCGKEGSVGRQRRSGQLLPAAEWVGGWSGPVMVRGGLKG
jgi:hypothetical protein